MYQVDGCERKVMAGTFDRLVRQLAGEEKPGTYARGCSEGRRGDASMHVPSASLPFCTTQIPTMSPYFSME